MKDNTYTIIPQSSAAEIRELHAEIIAAARTSLTKAICIRELLTQEKARLRHGEWLAWVRANLPFSDDTARNYMRVYAKRDQIPNSSEFGLADAYRLLNPPAEPTELETFPVAGVPQTDETIRRPGDDTATQRDYTASP